MNKYEIILDVCRTGSISKTAAKYNYTQPAVSLLIKNFEKELGLPLFMRTKYGVSLLPYTEEIAKSLECICREEEKIRQIAADLRTYPYRIDPEYFISLAAGYIAEVCGKVPEDHV